MKHTEMPKFKMIDGDVVYIEGEKAKELIDLEKRQKELHNIPMDIHIESLEDIETSGMHDFFVEEGHKYKSLEEIHKAGLIVGALEPKII